MQSIESTIAELGGIFQQLAHMIKEQVIVLAKHSEMPLKSKLIIGMDHSTRVVIYSLLSFIGRSNVKNRFQR